jgi:hypothetical protein
MGDDGDYRILLAIPSANRLTLAISGSNIFRSTARRCLLRTGL